MRSTVAELRQTRRGGQLCKHQSRPRSCANHNYIKLDISREELYSIHNLFVNDAQVNDAIRGRNTWIIVGLIVYTH